MNVSSKIGIKKLSMPREITNGKYSSSEQTILSLSLSTRVSSLNYKRVSIKHETKEPEMNLLIRKKGEYVLDNFMNSKPTIVEEIPKDTASLITYSFPSHHLFRIGIRAEVGYSIITGLSSIVDNVHHLSPFMDAWEGGAQDQLQGQIASAKIPLSRMISPALYWVMTGDDFSLDINNPNEPKVLVVGNNPDRQNIYSAALGLYNSRIVKLINKKKQLKSSVIIDELPTIYFRGLDNLIATARSNKVAVCLGFQDFSQLTRDYGDKESKVIQNTVGNVFSGQVVGETAKTLSERFGKVLQQRQSMTINRNDKSTSISTQMDCLIPASKISNLTQGMFVGAVSDNLDERIKADPALAHLIKE